jgi:hypothetical protein
MAPGANGSGKQGLNIDAAQVRLQHVGILKAADVERMLFQDFVFHVKAIDLPALDQGLAFKPLANQNAVPKTFNLLGFLHPGIFC